MLISPGLFGGKGRQSRQVEEEVELKCRERIGIATSWKEEKAEVLEKRFYRDMRS